MAWEVLHIWLLAGRPEGILVDAVGHSTCPGAGAGCTGDEQAASLSAS